MRKILFIILLIIPTFLTAQKKADLKGYYPVLKSVTIDGRMIKAGVVDSLKTSFQDDLMKIIWAYSIDSDEFSIAITNKSDKSFKVLWQECGFVSSDSTIERLFFGGQKYFGRYSEQLPTRIFSGATLANKVGVYSFVDENLKKVNILSMKDVSVWKKLEEYENEAAGKNFKFILLVDSASGIKEYTFGFGARLHFNK